MINFSNWSLEGIARRGGRWSHAEGSETQATGDASHAEGSASLASGGSSHAEGSGTATGSYSHAEGGSTTAGGNYSHAEGISSTAAGTGAHSEGNTTSASGDYSHAEGSNTSASGTYSTAEGLYGAASRYGQRARGGVNPGTLNQSFGGINQFSEFALSGASTSSATGSTFPLTFNGSQTVTTTGANANVYTVPAATAVYFALDVAVKGLGQAWCGGWTLNGMLMISSGSLTGQVIYSNPQGSAFGTANLSTTYTDIMNLSCIGVSQSNGYKLGLALVSNSYLGIRITNQTASAASAVASGVLRVSEVTTG